MIDTTGFWGIIFEDSKYHDFMIRNLSGKTAYVLDVQVLEILRVIYRTFSEYGKKFGAGLAKLVEVTKFLEDRIYETKGIRIIYIETKHSDYFEAINILQENPEIFAREGPENTLWPEVVDSIIAVFWRRHRATLYTNDESLIKYGEQEKLDYITIKQS